MVHFISITMSGHENAFCVSGPKWGESTGDQWIPSQRASNEGIWSFLCYDPELAVLQNSWVVAHLRLLNTHVISL